MQVRWRRGLSHALLAAHLAALTVGVFPKALPKIAPIRLIWAYLRQIGFEERWAPFAPNPPVGNIRLEVDLLFADGSRTVWDLPRMNEMSVLERSCKARYTILIAQLERYRRAMPDLLRYAARLHRNPLNPPRTATLVLRAEPIPPPTWKNQRSMPQQNLSPYQRTLFVYEIRPEDLR